jgi:hypothetical protein
MMGTAQVLTPAAYVRKVVQDAVEELQRLARRIDDDFSDCQTVVVNMTLLDNVDLAVGDLAQVRNLDDAAQKQLEAKVEKVLDDAEARLDVAGEKAKQALARTRETLNIILSYLDDGGQCHE